MIKHRLIILFFTLSISSCATTNPAEYIAGIFDSNSSEVNNDIDKKEEQEKEEKIKINSNKDSIFSKLIFWDTQPAKDTITSSLNMNLLWSVDIGEGRDALSGVLQPAFDSDETIYTIDTDGLISSVNIISGDINWKFNVDLDVTSGLLYYKEILYFGTSDGYLYGFSIEELSNNQNLISRFDFTGMLSDSELNPELKVALKSEIASPAIGLDNLIFFKLADGDTVAINILTSEIQWIHDGKNIALSMKGSAAISSDAINLYVARDDGNFISLSNDTGKLNWLAGISPRSGRNELESLRDIEMTPIVQDGLVYVGSYQGSIISVDTLSGDIVWRKPISVHSNLEIDDDKIYIPVLDGHIHALDRFSGEKIWSTLIDNKSVFTKPTIIDNFLVGFNTDGYIGILDASDGKKVHFNKIIDEVDMQSDILLMDKVLYIVTRNGRLNAIKFN